MGKHQTAAVLRCLEAGAPLTSLRAGTWTLRLDPWGRAHPTSCTEERKDAPTVEKTFDELLEEHPAVEDARRDRSQGRPRRNCHGADAIVGAERTYLREIDARVRPLLEMRSWLEKGQLPSAVVGRARMLQDERLGRLPGLVELPEEDTAWLAQQTVAADAELDAALAVLPGRTRAAKLTAMLRMLAVCFEAAAAVGDGYGLGGRNATGVVAREALSVTLAADAAPHLEPDALKFRLRGRGVPPVYAVPAFDAARAAAQAMSVADLTGPDPHGESPDMARLAAFTVGTNLDVPLDGVAGVAVAAVWLGAAELYTATGPAVAGVAGDGGARRTPGRGVAVVPADLARAAGRVAALERDSRAGTYLSRCTFDVVDAGAWDLAGDEARGDVLETMLRLWQVATTGPLAGAENALTAAVAIHA